MRTARELLRQGRERSTSPFHDFRLARGVTWLEPTLTVELTYSEIMEGRLRSGLPSPPLRRESCVGWFPWSSSCKVLRRPEGIDTNQVPDAH
jgi:hypothetical protein